MSSTSEKTDKDRNARLWSLVRGEDLHVRVGQGKRDGTRVELIGEASFLHGPRGLCTCCPRSTAPRPRPRVAEPDAVAPVVERDLEAIVKALIHPLARPVERVEHADPTPTFYRDVDHAKVRAAAHRFRPGQPLTWRPHV